MIKHNVFWRLNESAYGNDKQTNAQILKEKLLAMQGKVDGLLKVEVGFDFSKEKDSCDVTLYSEFTSKESLHQYQIHPDHQEIKKWLSKVRYERRSCIFRSVMTNFVGGHLKLLVLLLSLFSICIVFPQTSTARFLYWQPSAEIRALGGAGVSIVGNSFSAYYNPASFAFDTTLNFSASFTQPFSDFKNTSHSFISASLPITKVGTFAISLNAFWIENQAHTSEADPSPLGLSSDNPELFSPTHWQFKLSYANKINENIALGVNLSLLSISLTDRISGQESDYEGTTYAFLLDGGVLIKDILSEATYLDVKPIQNSWIDNTNYSGFSLGLSLLNIGQKISYYDPTYKDSPPAFALFGFSYWPVFTNLFSDRILIDYEKKLYDSGKYDLIHIGNEIVLFKLVSLRGGYVINTGDIQENYFTYGLGVKTKYFSVNVARYNQFIKSSWHFDARLTLEL